jgi:hypothetical protein
MNTVNGLPAHILLVHAVVVLIPLSAFLLLVTALWPATRRRLAGPNAILAVGSLILIPITTSAGEWLERHVPRTALIERHTHLGDTALWFSLPVALLALVVWWRGREADAIATRATAVRARRTYLAPASAALTIVIAVLSVAAAGSAAFDIYRIGDSGAQASWNGRVSAVSNGPER